MNILTHPATIHFPLALLLTGSALELWVAARPQAELAGASKVLLRLGWWSSLLALLSGLLDAALRLAAIQANLGWANGHVLAALLSVAVYWRLVLGRPLAPAARRRWLVVGMILLIATGWLGGRLRAQILFL